MSLDRLVLPIALGVCLAGCGGRERYKVVSIACADFAGCVASVRRLSDNRVSQDYRAAHMFEVDQLHEVEVGLRGRAYYAVLSGG